MTREVATYDLAFVYCLYTDIIDFIWFTAVGSFCTIDIYIHNSWRQYFWLRQIKQEKNSISEKPTKTWPKRSHDRRSSIDTARNSFRELSPVISRLSRSVHFSSQHPPPSTGQSHRPILTTSDHPPLLQKPRLRFPWLIFPWRWTRTPYAISIMYIKNKICLIKNDRPSSSQSQQLLAEILEWQAVDVEVMLQLFLCLAWC